MDGEGGEVERLWVGRGIPPVVRPDVARLLLSYVPHPILMSFTPVLSDHSRSFLSKLPRVFKIEMFHRRAAKFAKVNCFVLSGKRPESTKI